MASAHLVGTCRQMLLVCACWLSVGIASAFGAEPMVLFAAASLKESADDIAKRYASETGQAVVVSVGGSAALARQIEQGAPADLFIAADVEWMDWLAARDLLRPERRVDLLGNDLVVIVAAEPAEPALLWTELPRWFARYPEDERVALAQTDSVPAGKYAKAALQSLGLWPAVQRRLVETENVRAALLLVAREEAGLGVVYRTDALVEPRVRVLASIPADQHPPIVYPLAVLRASVHPGTDHLFRWLQSEPAKAVFRHHGFRVP